MEDRTTNKLIYSSNENKFTLDYSKRQVCNCCTYSNSLFYCICDCHKNKPKEKNIQSNDYSEIDFENLPNLNINELKMKSLKDYANNNNYNNYNNYNYNSSYKNLNPSKSSANLGNYSLNTNNNGRHLLSLKKRIENNLDKIKMSCLNKSQEANYINSQKNINVNNISNNNNNTLNDLNFKEVANHYKTQKNFNTLKKYYQLNNNINENINYTNNNSALKSQIEFHKLLNSIKGNEIKNNINANNSNMEYNPFTERDKRHYTKINGYNLNLNSNSIRLSNNSNNSNNSLEDYVQQIKTNNIPRNTVNYNRNNRILEKYQDQNNTNSNFNDFCSNTEYDKPFRSLNMDNGNIFKDKPHISNINEMSKINNNTSIQIPSNSYLNNIKDKYNYSSRNSFIENNNNKSNISNININQNGGANTNNIINSAKKLKLDDDSISYNSSILNKSYNKSGDLSQNNISHTEPRYSNVSKNTENDNVNIKSNYLDTNISHNENENKNEMIESKDFNVDNNNNFIVTFGARSNNDIKNIIASVKNEKKDNGKGNENSDQKINNIIIDYENLKKRYAPNKLFTGLQNNIKDLNQNIHSNKNIKLNLIQNNYSNKSTINTSKPTNTIKNNYSKYNFEIYIPSDSDKNIIKENEQYKIEINNLNNELSESKMKIEELNKIIKDYQKEIYTLKNQMTKSKKDYSLNESKITINNISTSNNNINYSNKKKIGKDSFIIKIPETLKRNNMNRDKKSRNNSSSNTKNNNTHSNKALNTNRNLQDKYYNIYNISNTSNQISHISNYTNTNSNCLTNNDISSNNISTNNIINNNKEIYVKKITTTMKKKMRKCMSQKLRINKYNNNLSLDNQDNLKNNNLYSNRNKKNDNKFNNDRYIYSLYQKDNKLVILSFDVIKKEFNFINFTDYDNFELNYNENYQSRGDNLFNNNSIFSNNNNNMYIVTGKNTDLLYVYNNKTKSMKKLCIFKNNHAKGSLLIIDDKIYCFSGNHNKKTEFYSQIQNNLGNLEEMNVERSNFSTCVFQNKYIFALFGYNYPTQQHLDTIEFYELNDNFKNEYEQGFEYGWKYFKFQNDKMYNLNIEGHICFNYNEQKIIFFGGINAEKNNSEDNIYELVINNDNLDDDNYGGYVEKIEKSLNDNYKNGYYFFGNNNRLLFEENNNWILASFDNNSFLHILDINNLTHNVYYFE
jgi:hypothetical protein